MVVAPRLEEGADASSPPAPAEAALQYIDVRDLAAWMLRCAEGGVGGAYKRRRPPPRRRGA
ncbi:hypothetical protein GCM10020219_008040 [Nonomuraea dietziae]